MSTPITTRTATRHPTMDEGAAAQQAPTPPPFDALRHAPSFLLRRLVQAHTAAWAAYVPEVTEAQFAVLTVVEAHPGHDQGALARMVALDRSTMADVCQRLEQRGLLRRTTSTSDGRRKTLWLTHRAIERLSVITAQVRALYEVLGASGVAPHPMTEARELNWVTELAEFTGTTDLREPVPAAADQWSVLLAYLPPLASRWEEVAQRGGLHDDATRRAAQRSSERMGQR